MNLLLLIFFLRCKWNPVYLTIYYLNHSHYSSREQCVGLRSLLLPCTGWRIEVSEHVQLVQTGEHQEDDVHDQTDYPN